MLFHTLNVGFHGNSLYLGPATPLELDTRGSATPGQGWPGVNSSVLGTQLHPQLCGNQQTIQGWGGGTSLKSAALIANVAYETPSQNSPSA